MASETEDTMLPKDSADSPTTEETSSGEKSCGGPLKKGPWTSAEDAILVDYVNKHGEGNWNAVQKHSGLFRCGKSCRLRWANHLRPDLKKGAFTPEEERRIIELHAKMGNKWARMASELPGRTDNEIKNFWNTRIKRRQRAGLPIYPPDISQALHENQQYQNMSLTNGNMHLQEPLPATSFEIPAVEFKNLELDEQFYPTTLLDIPTTSLLDMPASRLLSQGIGSSRSSNLMYSMPHPPKRLRESDCLLNSIGDGFQAFEQYQDGVCEKLREPFGFSASYDQHGNVNRLPSPSALSGCHALINGNSSPSESISWAMKVELPSLQYSDTQAGTWESPFSQPESMSTLNQSQPVEQAEADCLSNRNSGLLDAVLYESKTLKTSKNNSSHQLSGNTIVSGDVDSSSQNMREPEWEMNSDPISPLGHSAASVFSECTPLSGTSMDDTHMVDTSPGSKVKHESTTDLVGTKTDGVQEDANQMTCSRPDFLLASNWFGHNTEKAMEHSILTEAIGALLGDDSESKQSPAYLSSPPSGQIGGGGESCAWQKNPPTTACELSGITGNH